MTCPDGALGRLSMFIRKTAETYVERSILPQTGVAGNRMATRLPCGMGERPSVENRREDPAIPLTLALDRARISYDEEF